MEGKLKNLENGKAAEFVLRMLPGKGANSGAPWVGLTVEYNPDYAELEKKLNNPAVFPNPQARRKLLENNAENKKENARITDGTRCYFEKGEVRK